MDTAGSGLSAPSSKFEFVIEVPIVLTPRHRLGLLNDVILDSQAAEKASYASLSSIVPLQGTSSSRSTRSNSSKR